MNVIFDVLLGKIRQSDIHDTYLGTAASEALMLSQWPGARAGDYCTRTDTTPANLTYLLTKTPHSTLGNWVQIPIPPPPVTSVNGRVGAVTVPLSPDNKKMAAEVTVNDEDEACATGITTTPRGYVIVAVNGHSHTVGDGAKTSDCYFSGDGGTTARTISAIVSGDKLYWVGSVALYQLQATDIIDFNYSV